MKHTTHVRAHARRCTCKDATTKRDETTQKLKKLAKKEAHIAGEYAKKEYATFKTWLAKKKQQRRAQKALKEETGMKLETYE